MKNLWWPWRANQLNKCKHMLNITTITKKTKQIMTNILEIKAEFQKLKLKKFFVRKVISRNQKMIVKKSNRLEKWKRRAKSRHRVWRGGKAEGGFNPNVDWSISKPPPQKTEPSQMTYVENQQCSITPTWFLILFSWFNILFRFLEMNLFSVTFHFYSVLVFLIMFWFLKSKLFLICLVFIFVILIPNVFCSEWFAL